MGACLSYPILRSGACTGALLLLAVPAYAQTSADPGHLQQRFQPLPPPPSVNAPIEIPVPTAPTPPPQSASVQFTVSSVSFEGNTVLSNSALQALAASYIGKNITLAQAYELAGRVTAAYRDAGYILARAVVPAQRVSDGHLRIQIVEGYIDKVTIQGDAGGARSYLDAYGARIAAVHPLTAKVLERELLLASDLSGMNVRSILTASQTTPGAADLTLVVQPKKVDAFLQVDNRGSRYLGPYEVMGSVYFNDPFNTGGRLGVNGVVTPNRGPDLAYGGVSFDQPLGDDGMRLFTALDYAATKPGSVLRELDTQGSAFNSSAALSYPFIRSRDFNLLGSTAFESHDVRSTNINSKLFDDHIRSLNAQIFLNALDDWGGYSTLSVSLTQGLPIFGATSQNDTDKSRANASGEYTRANFLATHEQPLTSRFSLFVSAGGQTSFGESLLSSEQFSLGGDNFDRAFDPSEVTGDSALAGRAEGRFNVLDRASVFSGVQLYGFFEGGEIWQSQPLPGTPGSQVLSSAGAGVRFTFGDRFNTDLEWAKPLDRNVLGTQNENSRFFFSVGINL